MEGEAYHSKPTIPKFEKLAGRDPLDFFLTI